MRAMLVRSFLAAAVLGGGVVAVPPPAQALSLTDTWVQRAPDGTYLVNWRDPGPVDVYVSTDSDAPVTAMKLASAKDSDGRAEIKVPAGRPYFLLKSQATGETLRVAERLLPLEGSSNFRDLGGYQTQDGRHVKWGMLYRTGAMPSLTDGDYAYLEGLGVKVICDLRTVDERAMVPTKWRSVREPRYAAVDYTPQQLFGPSGMPTSTAAAAGAASGLYSDGPVLLKAQYKQIFDTLLAGEVPMTYNCTAGQDRTGIASALILSALGVPRHLIYQDYHLSTEYRRTDRERGKVDFAKFDSPMARVLTQPGSEKPRPLMTANGESYLAVTFANLDKTYGGVEGYLQKELNVGPAEIARLKALYLE